MKRLFSLFVATAAIGLAAAPADATLYDRGGGFIYDDDLNITWLQDANYAMTSGYDDDGRMTSGDALSWADTLTYGGYSDWRLPTYDGISGYGYNITIGNEMGHLYYTELNNLGYLSPGGTPQPGWGLVNTGPFINLPATGDWTEYWTSSEVPIAYANWGFSFNHGGTFLFDNDVNLLYALAVRDGDSAAASVPEPGTLLLLGSGLTGLAFIRRKLRGLSI